MPPVFLESKKLKVIEYGQTAPVKINWSALKETILRPIKRKAA